MQPIRITVYGIAKPAGSKRAFTLRRKNGKIGVGIEDSCESLPEWMASVAAAASIAMGGRDPMTCPLSVFITVVLPRPKGDYRANGELKPSAPAHHTKKPDATKLQRGIEDAMTGIVWKDDSQVVRICTEKRPGERPRAEIVIRPMESARPSSATKPAELF